jgi:hypothetical protein
LPTAAIEAWVGKHRNLGLGAIAHDCAEDPFTVMPITKRIGLYITFLGDASLMGRPQ